ncbi:MAG: thioredoxin [Bacteroidota bacterium]
MKKIYSLIVGIALVGATYTSFTSCNNANSGQAATTANDSNKIKTEAASETEAKVNYLTTDEFVAKIFDFRKNTEWKYLGKEPCVIDFYADWCGPCKKVAPIMEELAKQYNGKVHFYKMNTDKEREIANSFGIQSIPSILFIPVDGKPQMTTGLYPKESYIEMINAIVKK